MGSWSQGGGRASFTRMSWTWTGYDYDPVFRYKEEANFFQTGRNNAEARFWQTKVHEGDRRGTKSQIEIGSDGDSVKDHADVARLALRTRPQRMETASTRRRRTMYAPSEIATTSTDTGGVRTGILASVILSTRRPVMTATRGEIGP